MANNSDKQTTLDTLKAAHFAQFNHFMTLNRLPGQIKTFDRAHKALVTISHAIVYVNNNA